MPSTPVSIATDMTMPLIPPLITSHDFVTITPPATGTTMSLEAPVTIMWPPGFAGLAYPCDGKDRFRSPFDTG